jgi:hypothetical protein
MTLRTLDSGINIISVKDYFHAYAFHTVKHIHIVRYELNMLSDGSTSIERIEDVEEEEATTSKQKMIMIP